MGALYWNEHGGEPVNTAEKRVVQKLLNRLPDSALVIPSLDLRYENTIDEIDVLVVTEDAVIVVEVKDYRGRVLFGEQRHLVNGEPRTDPVRLTNAKARRLKSKLSRDPSLRRIWVSSQTILASRPSQLEIEPSLQNAIVHVDEAADRLTDRSAIFRLPNWDVSPVDKEAVKVSLRLHARKRSPGRVYGNYRATKLLEKDDSGLLYQAEHLLSGRRVLMRVFFNDPFIQTQGQQRRTEQQINAFRLVHDLGDREPRVKGPIDAFYTDDGEPVIIGRERTDPLLADLELSDLTDERRIATLRDVSAAIAAAHTAGTAHRNIDPRNIEVSLDASPTTSNVAFLSGWDRARDSAALNGQTQPTVSGIMPGFVPPELINQDVKEAAALDLFTLGALIDFLWSDGWSLTGEIGEALGEASKTLQKPDPDDRELTAGEIQEICSRALSPGIPEASPEPETLEDIVPGLVLDSRYRVEAEIGIGGVGRVVRAHDITANRAVALKLFSSNIDGDAVLREFRTLFDIHHRAIVRVFDAQVNRRFGHYLVTEFVEGSTLRTLILEGQCFAEEAAVGAFKRTLEALDEFHPTLDGIGQRGVVHRDIKPENLIVAPEDRGLVLVDFGIASSATGGAPAGTRGYRPPGALADVSEPDLDLFAVGISLHEALTGKNPYLEGEQILDTPVIDVELSGPMQALLRKAVASDKTTRYATAGEFLTDLGETLLGDRWETTSRLGQELHPVAEQLDHPTDPVTPEEPSEDASPSTPEELPQRYEPVHDGELIRLPKEMSLLIRSGRDTISIAETIGGEHDVQANVVGAEIRAAGQAVRLNVRWVSADNGELWIEGTEAFNSPPQFQRLVGSFRMGSHPIEDSDSRRFIELRQTTTENQPWQPRIRQVSLDGFNMGTGVDAAELLVANGACAIGTRENTWGDQSRRRNVLCMVHEREDVRVALIAYALSRVAPLLDEASPATTDDRRGNRRGGLAEGQGPTGGVAVRPEDGGQPGGGPEVGLVEQLERSVSFCRQALENYEDAWTGDRYRSAIALSNAQRFAEAIISRTDHVRALLEPVIDRHSGDQDLVCIPQTQLTTSAGRYRRDTFIDWHYSQDSHGRPLTLTGSKRFAGPDNRPNALRLWITDQGVGMGVVFARRDALARESLRWDLKDDIPNGFEWEKCMGRQWRESPWHLVGFDGQLFLSHWHKAENDKLRDLEENLPITTGALIRVLDKRRKG